MSKKPLHLAYACVALLLTLVLTGCFGRTIEVGPIRFTAVIGEGTLLADLFGGKGVLPITNRQDLCNIPTQDQIEEQVLQAGGVDLTNFVRLSGLDLVQTTLTATSGDFNFLSEITVRYIPAPVNGEEQDPVELGTASNPSGLGTVVTLIPPAPVDFLDLIQANDENPSEECPELEIVATVRSVPSQDVSYEIATTIDAYARVGVMN